jgi:hypothetical protein
MSGESHPFDPSRADAPLQLTQHSRHFRVLIGLQATTALESIQFGCKHQEY